jgi:integrase/recombinase XerC
VAVGGQAEAEHRAPLPAHRQDARRWLEREGILPADPLRAVRLAREQQDEPHIITSDELARLVAACAMTLQPLRNKAVLALLADSGIRVSGLCGLNMGDVTMPTARQEHGSAHIRLKGGDHRAFPFGRKTASAMRNYTALERDGPPMARCSWGARASASRSR